MLLWFTLGNYRSFKDKATLSLQATSSDELEDTNVYHKDGLRILKTAAIYGPNGGGKSNFLRGLSFMKEFVEESSTKMQAGETIKTEPFLLSEQTEKEPSYFEVAFKTENALYQYGFEVDTSEVKREWLYQTVDRKRVTLFQRDGMHMKKVGRKFGAGKAIQKMTRNNSLFLSVASQFNVQIAKEVFKWFGHVMDFIDFDVRSFQQVFAHFYTDNMMGKSLRDVLNILGFNGEGLSVDLLPPNAPLPSGMKWLRDALLKDGDGNVHKLTFHHDQRDKEGKIIGTTGFDVSKMESLGTQKVMALLPLVNLITHTSTLGVLDELESSLHPILAKALIHLIHQKTVTNEGQLIFATHDTNLLAPGLLRRDQVWLTPKNQFEESQLVSLVEYKVKKEHNMEKGYLEGRYGAIPYIGSMEPKIITPLNGKETRKTAKKKS